MRFMHKPSEALLSQVFQVVVKINRREKGKSAGKGQKGYIFAFGPVHKEHIRNPKGTVPSVED